MAGVKRNRAQASAKKESKTKSASKKDAKKEVKKNKRDLKKQVKDTKRDPSPAKDEGVVEVKTSVSNGVIVDHLVPNPQQYTIVKYNNAPLNAHLMFADCGHNNNKFYIIQGLKCGGSYHLWTRWGRVGVDGMNSLVNCGVSEHSLANTYNKKLREKTSKGYTQIEISYDDVKEEKPKQTKKKSSKASKLPKEVQDLMKFIFDMNLIEQSVVKVGYNPKKASTWKVI